MEPPTGQGRRSEQLDSDILGSFYRENVRDYTKPSLSAGGWRPNFTLSGSFVGCFIVSLNKSTF